MEHDLMRDMSALEHIDNESAFMVSCNESEVTKKHQPPVGDVELEGTEMLALIDTGATVNVMDMIS